MRKTATALALLAALLAAGCNYETAERALERGDRARAVDIWRNLADWGDTRSALALAQLSLESETSPEGLAEAERLFRTVLSHGEDWQKGWARLGLGQVALTQGRPADAAAMFEAARSDGIAWAALSLARLHRSGEGVARDPTRAAMLARQAADADIPQAATLLGELHEAGEGVPPDEAEAIRWYDIGRKGGDPWAAYRLGLLHARQPDGAGRDAAIAALREAIDKDIPPAATALGDLMLGETGGAVADAPGAGGAALIEAAALYRLGMDRGDGWAAFRLARLIEQDRIEDDADPLALYALAAERGVAPALTALGRIHAEGVLVPRDEARALDYLERAIAAGDPPARLARARLMLAGDVPPGEMPALIATLEEAAGAGNGEAAKLLGDIAAQGRAGKADPLAARRRYEQALALGFDAAGPLLATNLLASGKANEARRAAALLEAAAERGDGNAMARLARLKAEGIGGPADPAAARRLYLQAADAGIATARKPLADMMKDGIGGPRDMDGAMRWYRAAAGAGDGWAALELARLVDPDGNEALSLLRQAAGTGIAPAQKLLGDRLAAEPDGAAEAARWYGLAADAGDGWAAFELAQLMRAGKVEGKPEAMAALYRKAADAGVAAARVALGDLDPERADAWYEAALAEGDPFAALKLAERALARGGDNPVDGARTLDLLRMAAARDLPGAQRLLGDLHATGRLVPEDPALAAQWYRRALAKDDPYAALALAGFYLEGRGVAADRARALELYRRAADAGLAEAARRLGDLLNDPAGQPDLFDPALAASWYRKAADAGDIWARLALVKLYLDGRLPGADGAAMMADLEALAKGGMAPAQKLLGDVYRRGDHLPADEAASIAWHEKAAEGGDGWAQLALAERYIDGRDGLAQDDAAANALLARAAARGILPAQRLLADRMAGPGATEEELKTAVTWYRKAADAGDPWSQYRLGELHLTGRGLEADIPRALELFRLAAAGGLARAAATLGDIYRLGAIVEKDEDEARHWYRVASELRRKP